MTIVWGDDGEGSGAAQALRLQGLTEDVATTRREFGAEKFSPKAARAYHAALQARKTFLKTTKKASR